MKNFRKIVKVILNVSCIVVALGELYYLKQASDCLKRIDYEQYFKSRKNI